MSSYFRSQSTITVIVTPCPKIQTFIRKLFRQSKFSILFLLFFSILFISKKPKQLKLMLIMVKPPQITMIVYYCKKKNSKFRLNNFVINAVTVWFEVGWQWDSIKDVVRSSVKVPEFDKHQKTGGHIDRNVVEIIKKHEDNSLKTLNDKKHLM